MDVAVTGSSGLIGSALGPALARAGHRMVPVVRSQSAPTGDAVRWDPDAGTIDAGELEGIGAVVHLAGENIGGSRWNEAQKARIRESRVKGTTLLAQTLAKLTTPPEALVSASGVNFYGDRGDEILTEVSPPGSGFLTDVCRAWEAATAPAEEAGIRVVHLRNGIVLSPSGGALQKMLTPFKLGVGGKMGSGRQWMSWISIDDEVGAIIHLLGEGAPAGPVNATSPNPMTNSDFSRALAKAVKRPAVTPVPAPALRLLLGRQMADELLLGSMRVLPTRLLDAGYAFSAPDLGPALERMLANG
jgi:uncharacterized protein